MFDNLEGGSCWTEGLRSLLKPDFFFCDKLFWLKSGFKRRARMLLQNPTVPSLMLVCCQTLTDYVNLKMNFISTYIELKITFIATSMLDVGMKVIYLGAFRYKCEFFMETR